MNETKKTKLLVLIGPTAVGKTKMSLDVSKKFHCEIISGDSMQVYRGMDIGTAKASDEERRTVPHHLIDIHDPDEPFSVSDFQENAKSAIHEITTRGNLPFIVGGTGLYIESLCYNFSFSTAGSDEEFRAAQQKYALEHGEQALYEKLIKIDPKGAENIHFKNVRRVIRALEVYHLTGKPFSEHANKSKESPYQLCIIGLTMDRAMLYHRIEQRIDQMIEQGLIEEVKKCIDLGYTKDMVSMQGLGYKEIITYLEGEISLERAIYLLKRNTRRFAKRQLSWFRRMEAIKWVDVTNSKNYGAHLKQIHDIIEERLQ
ncbi:tRNA (adenosine(37)-N6)-dimethylallyltransferase MiaA [Chengkuizengella axinellae]|uniref:tRNA dimethylallyltransferase n=1 Tax=Chengkuizengella axinellae TaxID=3064388 RepID=A0ABT9IX69_9BACL|nr:tRNA (adenosine(37)-N6)-dimethylallyltransferase MiaA [Chengkuizengella sp. 2205SS18-9]MDP5273971.1 tRNA (adenosine(37)-N6)-dimethylallyltransferase MiaA [Chengkuizengella sp. 2205SS18-9]